MTTKDLLNKIKEKKERDNTIKDKYLKLKNKKGLTIDQRIDRIEEILNINT